MAQCKETGALVLEVAGSIPTGGANCFAFFLLFFMTSQTNLIIFSGSKVPNIEKTPLH